MSHDDPAVFRTMQGKYADAEPLYERCRAIRERFLDPWHPALATTLNDLAELYKTQVRVGGEVL